MSDWKEIVTARPERPLHVKIVSQRKSVGFVEDPSNGLERPLFLPRDHLEDKHPPVGTRYETIRVTRWLAGKYGFEIEDG